ncbi:sigma-54-dependent transcriptional regulator [Chloroflexota bacterium]
MAGELGRVLVVDDEEIIRKLLQRTLEVAHYDVVTAASGEEALNKVSQMDFRVVLCDITMPGMSGIELLQQLTANWPETPVIMVTALADAQTAVEAMKMGAYDFIVKPFDSPDLLQKMHRAMEKRHLLLEQERHRLEIEQKVTEHATQLQQQFKELVESLSREHELLYQLTESKRGDKSLLKRLPKELQKPMASFDEFSEALIRMLRKGVSRPKL